MKAIRIIIQILILLVPVVVIYVFAILPIARVKELGNNIPLAVILASMIWVIITELGNLGVKFGKWFDSHLKE